MARKATTETLEKRVRDLEKALAACKKENETLRESEKRLSLIIRDSAVPALAIDQNHVITHCNRAYEKLKGIPAEKMVGTRNQWMTFYRKPRPVMVDFLVDGAPEEKIMEYFGKWTRKSKLVEGGYEAEIFFPDLGESGEWLFFTSAPLRDERGRTVGAIETFQDVTPRKKAEEALRQSERRFRTLLDFVPYPIAVFNMKGYPSYVNPAFTQVFGWSLEELKGKKIPFVPEEAKQETIEDLKRLYDEKILLQHESKRLTKDGRVLDVSIRAAVYKESEEGPSGVIAIYRDITRRKQAEEALRQSERRFRTLLDFVPYPIGVFNMEGYTSYVNPGFTQVFGWALSELAGKKIPFVPEEVKRETVENLKRLYREKVLFRHESKRVTKDGRILDVSIRAAVYSESDEGPSGVIAIFRDITQEKRIARINEAMLHISMALPRYPDLEDLLDYVNSEVKRLLDSEGSVVILLDEEKQELFVIGAAYDATDTQKRVKEIRFSMDQLVAGRVIKTGRPLIVSDTTKERQLHEDRDRKLGYKTRNLALVPLASTGRIIGVLCAINKKGGHFVQGDIEMLEMIAGTVSLSIENARVSEELKRAYIEVSSLNRAKDKVINHLSHELRTPVAVLSGSLNLISKRLATLPDDTWKSNIEMARRNLDRIRDIEYEVEDIMEGRQSRPYALLSLLLDQCADELETLVAEETGEGPVVGRIRDRIEDIFGPKEAVPQEVNLQETVLEQLKQLKPRFAHREVELITQLEPVPPIYIPPEVLQKVIEGLIKNAVENTPDEGKIELAVHQKGEGALLVVQDYGVGIPEDAQRRIFEGFFTTQDTLAYSSKRPFDFNAGGKGADLLRMKIFSERYNFQIDMASTPCRFLSKETEACPGRISRCPFCSQEGDCHRSGGTLFSLYFPPAPSQMRSGKKGEN